MVGWATAQNTAYRVDDRDKERRAGQDKHSRAAGCWTAAFTPLIQLAENNSVDSSVLLVTRISMSTFSRCKTEHHITLCSSLGDVRALTQYGIMVFVG